MQHRRLLVLIYSLPLLWISAGRPARAETRVQYGKTNVAGVYTMDITCDNGKQVTQQICHDGDIQTCNRQAADLCRGSVTDSGQGKGQPNNPPRHVRPQDVRPENLQTRTPLGAAPRFQGGGGTPTPSGPAVARGWAAFWKCWWARDLEGDDYSFTAGCWDAHMRSTARISSGDPRAERRLRQLIAERHRLERGFEQSLSQELRLTATQ